MAHAQYPTNLDENEYVIAAGANNNVDHDV